MVTVHYNTPWLLTELLYSWNKFYPGVGFFVVDGSATKYKVVINDIIRQYGGTYIRNIRPTHGTGLARGLNVVGTDLALFLDSDIRIKERGYVERLVKCLSKMHYGAGMVTYVDEAGLSTPMHRARAIPYLHPHFMLVNVVRALKWPEPMDHGAPMLYTMKCIHMRKKLHLLVNLRGKRYYEHLWSGTVKKKRWPDPKAPMVYKWG
jgi:glycosyltransferase involved in cell wall biosynthesis